MYSKGHLEILKDALKIFDDEAPYFTSKRERLILLEGLLYPDFPCGKIDIVGNTMVEKMASCGLPRLLVSMFFKRLSLGYQSHKGFYSVWHGMSYDPEKSVGNIAKNVKEYVLICCKQAYEKRSLFWLGFALHIVMDSYSPAHVLRENSYTGLNYDDVVTWLKIYETELPATDKNTVHQLRDMIRSIVQDVRNNLQPSEIVDKVPPRLRSTAAFMLYDHLQRKTLPISISEHASTTKKRIATTFPIMNFYYYPQQGAIFHSIYDRLAEVRRADLYHDCVTDVYRMLQFYKQSTENIRYAPSRKGLKTYLHKVEDLLSTRTLAIHESCNNVDTGFDIARVLKPIFKTFAFLRDVSSSSGKHDVVQYRYEIQRMDRRKRDNKNNRANDAYPKGNSTSRGSLSSPRLQGVVGTTRHSSSTKRSPLMAGTHSSKDPTTIMVATRGSEGGTRSGRHRYNDLTIKWPSATVFELPVIKNHLTNPEVVLKRFTFKNQRVIRMLTRLAKTNTVHTIMYTFLTMHKYAGFPVKLVLINHDTTTVLRNPILIE